MVTTSAGTIEASVSEVRVELVSLGGALLEVAVLVVSELDVALVVVEEDAFVSCVSPEEPGGLELALLEPTEACSTLEPGVALVPVVVGAALDVVDVAELPVLVDGSTCIAVFDALEQPASMSSGHSQSVNDIDTRDCKAFMMVSFSRAPNPVGPSTVTAWCDAVR